MPGPGNQKARKKRQNKKEKNIRKKLSQINDPVIEELHATIVETQRGVSTPLEALTILRGESRASLPKPPDESNNIYIHPSSSYTPRVEKEQIAIVDEALEDNENGDWEYERDDIAAAQDPYRAYDEAVEPDLPYIYDPGNGPRVRDFLLFLKSPFAAPQTVEFDALGNDGSEVDIGIDLTAARVIPLLARILPGEFAAVLWYNRTRTTHRVCPACRRVYHLGEALKAHVEGFDSIESKHYTNQHTLAEQYISGTCSVPCFALSTYNYGPAAVLAFGLVWHQLDEGTRELLEGVGAGIDDQGLSLYIRISRCDGAGLRELANSL